MSAALPFPAVLLQASELISPHSSSHFLICKVVLMTRPSIALKIDLRHEKCLAKCYTKCFYLYFLQCWRRKLLIFLLFLLSLVARAMDWELRTLFESPTQPHPGTTLATPCDLWLQPCFKLALLEWKPKVCVWSHHPIYRMSYKFLLCVLCKVETECDLAFKNVNSYAFIIIIIIVTSSIF